MEAGHVAEDSSKCKHDENMLTDLCYFGYTLFKDVKLNRSIDTRYGVNSIPELMGHKKLKSTN